MGSSESSNNSLLSIKYRKIDHGKTIDFVPIPILRDEWLDIPWWISPKSLRKWVVSISSNASINHRPHPALFYQKMTLKPQKSECDNCSDCPLHLRWDLKLGTESMKVNIKQKCFSMITIRYTLIWERTYWHYQFIKKRHFSTVNKLIFKQLNVNNILLTTYTNDLELFWLAYTIFSKRIAHWFRSVLPVTSGHWPQPRVMSSLSNGLVRPFDRIKMSRDRSLWPTDLRKLRWFSCALPLEKTVERLNQILIFLPHHKGFQWSSRKNQFLTYISQNVHFSIIGMV